MLNSSKICAKGVKTIHSVLLAAVALCSAPRQLNQLINAGAPVCGSMPNSEGDQGTSTLTGPHTASHVLLAARLTGINAPAALIRSAAAAAVSQGPSGDQGQPFLTCEPVETHQFDVQSVFVLQTILSGSPCACRRKQQPKIKALQT